MGLVIGVPIAILVHRIFTSNKGKLHAVKEFVAYLYLQYLKRNTKRRLTDHYDIYSEDIFRLGVLVPPIERQLEFPRKHLENKSDNILIFGANSQNEQLTVRISRTSVDKANLWIYLRLSDGKRYVHEFNEQDFRVPKTNKDTFSAGGLRLKCLTPMRKWRISYNGMLREYTDGETDAQSVYCKFSFIWTTSSKVNDFSTDISSSVLSSYLASQTWNGWLPDITLLRDLEKYLDIYEQTGMICGTVSIQEQEEREIYLWGARQRCAEPMEDLTESLELYGTLKDGDYFHVSRIYLPRHNKSFDYGCIMMPTGFVHVMDNFELVLPDAQDEKEKFAGAHITFKRDKIEYKIKIDCSKESLMFGSNCIYHTPVTLDSDSGHAMIIYKSGDKARISEPAAVKSHQNFQVLSANKEVPLVAEICELGGNDVNIAGGKGSSLGQLSALSSKDNDFSVPNGIVITTKAYEIFMKHNTSVHEISSLQNAAWKNTSDLKEACQRAVTKISNELLPEIIQEAIKTKLEKIFENDFETKKYAIRSSALGEDSEDLSAAGQMDTFLGVCGLSEITKAVAKCWASQFSFTAIQYKRQNGQLLNTPMAVVVQEMVAADTAGVTFTCDPMTGNPSFVTLTANYGLGESVVSASSEPDTLVYERNSKNELKLHTTEIGKKSSKIVMADSNGVQEHKVTVKESSKCCINSENGLLLSQVALKVEDWFGCPMDIEWALKENRVYLLQARPVTTFDKETDFEIRHELDSALSCEHDYSSKANVGEVMPGATSPLGIHTISVIFMITTIKKWCMRSQNLFPFNPYSLRGFTISQNHILFNLLDTMLRFHKKEGSILTDSQLISLFGRILDDPQMFEMAEKRNKKDTSKSFAPLQICYFLGDMLFANRRLKKVSKEAHETDSSIKLQGCNTAQDIFMRIMQNSIRLGLLISSHSDASLSSSMLNLAVLSTLHSSKGEWDEDVFSDFASLVSNCPKVESVDVPCAMENLAAAIAHSIDPSTFKNMNSQEALQWLQTTDSESGRIFARFLTKHGHRCFKEFDVYAKPWGYDAIPLINTLKTMVGSSSRQKRDSSSVPEVLDALKVPLGWKPRLLFRFLIPFCRNAVSMREAAKSITIKSIDIFRRAYHRLADKMVEEGRLPDSELLYFLTTHEIDDLLKTRSPKLVQKAIRRKNKYKFMDNLQFPEVMVGIPTPLNAKKIDTNHASSFSMKGVPVSQGIAKGLARVATSLDEAAEIQPGEILIAYSTDIGWSPYFPMLAGVATELGGLISHGAVVAREYGLPCIVAVHGATQQFRTGDLVMLDGNKGLLEKIDKHEQSNGVANNF